ncbi:MAG: type II secretion system GspH family protein [Verrucomicrobiales bacterium]|nr:type II secretion system GspH family protein [Verrucomicrobiales bacterium]
MKVKTKNQGGFTLIELLVVITIIALLASMAMPAFNGIQTTAKITKDVNNCKQIVLSCRTFAADWDGVFPSFDPNANNGGGGGGNAGFSTSTEAFNVLIPEYMDTELIFWTPSQNPQKLRPPIEDGILNQNENSFLYVMGLTDTSFSRSPLIANGEMTGPGAYGEFHPWLAVKKAVVGYVGGQVVVEKLTSDQEGATVRSKDGQMQDIFQRRAATGGGGGGGGGGGLLAVDPGNILLP